MSDTVLRRVGRCVGICAGESGNLIFPMTSVARRSPAAAMCEVNSAGARGGETSTSRRSSRIRAFEPFTVQQCGVTLVSLGGRHDRR